MKKFFYNWTCAIVILTSCFFCLSCRNNDSQSNFLDQNEYQKQYEEELAKKEVEKRKLYKQFLEEEKQKLEEERQKLEEEKQRLEEESIKQEEERREKEREAIEKNSSHSTRNDSYNYSNGNTTVFNNVYDVLAYTNNIFREPTSGTVVSIREDALYVDGAPMTGAPEVLSFSRSTAVIRVHSPYLGGGALTIRVDASRGTLTDGAGDVYYKK